MSLSYTLATSRCLGGLAFVLTLKASVYHMGENNQKMTLFLPAATPGKLSTCKQDLDFGAAAASLLARSTGREKEATQPHSRRDLTVSSADPQNNSGHSGCLQNHWFG